MTIVFDWIWDKWMLLYLHLGRGRFRRFTSHESRHICPPFCHKENGLYGATAIHRTGEGEREHTACTCLGTIHGEDGVCRYDQILHLQPKPCVAARPMNIITSIMRLGSKQDLPPALPGFIETDRHSSDQLRGAMICDVAICPTLSKRESP